MSGLTVWVALSVSPSLGLTDIIGIGLSPDAARALCYRDCADLGPLADARITAWKSVGRSGDQAFLDAFESRPARHDGTYWRIEKYEAIG